MRSKVPIAERHTAFLAAACLGLATGCISLPEFAGTEVTGLTQCAVRVPGDHYIATIFPYEGKWPVGPSLESAMIQALDQINTDGGVGRDRSLLGAVVCNDKGDADTARQAVNELLHLEPEILGVIGPVHNGPVLAATKEVVRLTGSVGGMVLVSPVVNSRTALEVIDDRDNLFGYAPSIGAEARGALSAASIEPGDRILVLRSDDDDSSTFFQTLGPLLEAKGLVVNSAVYTATETGFASAALVKADVYQPDTVFLIGFPESVSAILRSAAETGYSPNKSWVLPSWAKRSELFELVGDDAYLEDGVVGVGPAFAASRSYVTFSNQYQNAWAVLPEVYAGHVYDAVYSLAMAVHLSDGKLTRAGVKEQLVRQFGAHAPKGKSIGPGEWARFRALGGSDASYLGATGPLVLDPRGNRVSAVETWSIRNGDFRTDSCVGAGSGDCE